MEERKLRSVLVLCLVLGLTEKSAANFQDCYKSCFILCVITPGESPLKCSCKCLKDCFHIKLPFTFNALDLDQSMKTGHACNLDCASALCTRFSSRENPAEEKVERCVDSCSETCNKRN